MHEKLKVSQLLIKRNDLFHLRMMFVLQRITLGETQVLQMMLPDVFAYAGDHFLHTSSQLLKLVEVLPLLGDTLGETLALANCQDNFLALGASNKR